MASIEKQFEKVREDAGEQAPGSTPGAKAMTKEERRKEIATRGKLAVENADLRLEVEKLRADTLRLATENADLRLRLSRSQLLAKGTQERVVEAEEEVRKLTRVVEEKEKLSRTDALTGLYNRHGYEVLAPTMYETFQSLVRESYQYAQQHGKEGMKATFNAIYIDLNDFKPINDTIGHAAGDRALKNVAEALRSAVRGTDKIFRMGGDEFLVLFVSHEEPVSGITTVVHNRFIIAERIKRALTETGFSHEGREIPPLTASIGAVVAHPEEGLTELIARADANAYEAKRNKVSVESGTVIEGIDAKGRLSAR